MKQMLALAALAAVLSGNPAPARAAQNAESQPVVVYFSGGQYTPSQVAAFTPDQIAGLAQSVVAQELVILGASRLNRDGRADPASPANQTAAVRYVRANRDAFNAAYALLQDLSAPDITPGNINDAGIIEEINRVARVNASNEAKRRAINAANEAIARPVGVCNVVSCSDW